MEAFWKSESAKCNADEYPYVKQASFAMNTICQEGRYSELGTKQKDLPTTMEIGGLQEKLEQFESQCPLFKFSWDYMKFVKCILTFIRASREGE